MAFCLKCKKRGTSWICPACRCKSNRTDPVQVVFGATLIGICALILLSLVPQSLFDRHSPTNDRGTAGNSEPIPALEKEIPTKKPPVLDEGAKENDPKIKAPKEPRGFKQIDPGNQPPPQPVGLIPEDKPDSRLLGSWKTSWQGPVHQYGKEWTFLDGGMLNSLRIQNGNPVGFQAARWGASGESFVIRTDKGERLFYRFKFLSDDEMEVTPLGVAPETGQRFPMLFVRSQ